MRPSPSRTSSNPQESRVSFSPLELEPSFEGRWSAAGGRPTGPQQDRDDRHDEMLHGEVTWETDCSCCGLTARRRAEPGKRTILSSNRRGFERKCRWKLAPAWGFIPAVHRFEYDEPR